MLLKVQRWGRPNRASDLPFLAQGSLAIEPHVILEPGWQVDFDRADSSWQGRAFSQGNLDNGVTSSEVRMPTLRVKHDGSQVSLSLFESDRPDSLWRLVAVAECNLHYTRAAIRVSTEVGIAVVSIDDGTRQIAFVSE